MKNFDGTALKKARDKRDQINSLSRGLLFSSCKTLNIEVSRSDKNDDLKKKLKKHYYSEIGLEAYELKLLNKETPLSNKEIDTYVNETLNKLYKESFKEDNSPKKIDSDLRLINAMRGRRWQEKERKE